MRQLRIELPDEKIQTFANKQHCSIPEYLTILVLETAKKASIQREKIWHGRIQTLLKTNFS